MLQVAGNHVYIVVAMLTFLQGHMFVYESLYLHYKRNHIKHYNVSHGSPHEVHLIAHKLFDPSLYIGHLWRHLCHHRAPMFEYISIVYPCSLPWVLTHPHKLSACKLISKPLSSKPNYTANSPRTTRLGPAVQQHRTFCPLEKVFARASMHVSHSRTQNVLANEVLKSRYREYSNAEQGRSLLHVG